jgi:hypothetical protein
MGELHSPNELELFECHFLGGGFALKTVVKLFIGGLINPIETNYLYSGKFL